MAQCVREYIHYFFMDTVTVYESLFLIDRPMTHRASWAGTSGNVSIHDCFLSKKPIKTSVSLNDNDYKHHHHRHKEGII